MTLIRTNIEDADGFTEATVVQCTKHGRQVCDACSICHEEEVDRLKKDRTALLEIIDDERRKLKLLQDVEKTVFSLVEMIAEIRPEYNTATIEFTTSYGEFQHRTVLAINAREAARAGGALLRGVR